MKQCIYKGFYAFILNYKVRVMVTDRTKSSRPRWYRRCASRVWSAESIWLRQQKYKSPHKVKEKRKNLKRRRQQHRLGIKCQINVPPAVPSILILSTSSTTLCSTAAVEAGMVIWFVSYSLSDNPIFHQYEQYELLKHPPVQSVGKSHTGNTKQTEIRGTNFASNRKQSARDERTNCNALMTEKEKRKAACYTARPGCKQKEVTTASQILNGKRPDKQIKGIIKLETKKGLIGR